MTAPGNSRGPGPAPRAFALSLALCAALACGSDDKPGAPGADGGSSPGQGGSSPAGQGGSTPAGSDAGTSPVDGTSPGSDLLPADDVAPANLDAGTDAASTPDVDGTAPDANPAAPNNPAPGQYGTRAVLLERNSEFATAALDGKVYVLGGYPSSPAATRPTLQIYDVATDRWTLGAPAPRPVHHPMLAGVNGKLYSLGGQRQGADPNTREVFEYNPADNMWRPRAAMPTARGGGAAAILGNLIYVVGARPPVAPDAVNALEVYDAVADTWESLPALPGRQNRNHLAAVGIAGKVYVAGGRYDGCCVGAMMTDTLDLYDPATKQWSSKAKMLRPRGGVAGVVAHGCFHVFGGEGEGIGEPNGVFPDHDVYDPKTDTWTAQPKLRIPFHGVTGGAFVNGLIYMPGGGVRAGGSSGTTMHQVFNPTTRCD